MWMNIFIFSSYMEPYWRRDGGVANTRVRVSAEVALNYLSYIQRDQPEFFYLQAGFLGWPERLESKVLALVLFSLAHLGKLNSNEKRMSRGRFNKHSYSDLTATSQCNTLVSVSRNLISESHGGEKTVLVGGRKK